LKTTTIPMQAASAPNNFWRRVINRMSRSMRSEMNPFRGSGQATVTTRVKWNIGVGLHDICW
ncbi:MAG: hypothetical protein OEW40_21010, partial [Cyclobacteriaceae bacterium]|nr:hypothetical protein [Cyclobacteriaceae bacterium]